MLCWYAALCDVTADVNVSHSNQSTEYTQASMSDNSTDRKHLRFSFDMTEKLIECVKKRPYLYDTKDPQYKNVAMKVKVWEQIGKEISETGQ